MRLFQLAWPLVAVCFAACPTAMGLLQTEVSGQNALHLELTSKRNATAHPHNHTATNATNSSKQNGTLPKSNNFKYHKPTGVPPRKIALDVFNHVVPRDGPVRTVVRDGVGAGVQVLIKYEKLKRVMKKMEGEPKNKLERSDCNIFALWLIGGIIVATLFGLFIDKVFPAWGFRKGRPRYWSIFMLLYSYIALVCKGYTGTLFSYAMSVTFLEKTLWLSLDGEKGKYYNECFADLFVHLAGFLGPFLLALFAVVIPFIKLTFLTLGEVWRFSPDPVKVQRARYCIKTVQFSSKWACPDMFAYILVQQLIDGVSDNAPNLYLPMQLGQGFTCFTMYCVCSTIASLSVKLPELPEKKAKEQVSDEPAPAPWLLRRFGSSAPGVVICLEAVFVAFFVAGCKVPIHRLDFGDHMLDDVIASFGGSSGMDKDTMRDMTEEVLKGARVNATAPQVVVALAHSFADGDVNTALSFIVFACLCVLATLANMAILLVVGMRIDMTTPEETKFTNSLMNVSYVFKYLSMMDVMVTGVVVFVLTAGGFGGVEFAISLCIGILFLAISEIAHYILFYSLQSAVKYQLENAKEDPEGKSV